MPPRQSPKASAPPTPHQHTESEINLPLGIKLKGAAIAKALPISGWVAALGVCYYFVSGPVLQGIQRLENRVSAVEVKLDVSSKNLDDMQRDIRRLYRSGAFSSRPVWDAVGDEVAARVEPTATARGGE